MGAGNILNPKAVSYITSGMSKEIWLFLDNLKKHSICPNSRIYLPVVEYHRSYTLL